MKKLILMTKTLVAVMVLTSAVSCSDDDENNNNNQDTILEIAMADTNFSVLVSALERTDLTATLDGEGTYTVFAPTNTAFNAFLSANGFANIDAVPVSVLREVLLNHVIATEEFSGDLTTGYIKTLAKGSASASNTLSMYVNTTSGVVLNGGTSNGGAVVTTADIEASNGVVHVVNGVIGLPTVVNHAIANPGLSTLVAALTRDDQPDFPSILSQNGPFTVFAPTNAAFGDLLVELGLSGLGDVPGATLTSALQYHVVAGNILSASLMNNQQVTTLEGSQFTVQTPASGAQILDESGRTSVIVGVDVQATNGIVHVLDTVLLPN